MRKLLAFFLIPITTFCGAQTFLATDFSSNGFPFSVGLTPAYETSTKVTENDTMLTTYATVSDITYVLSVSKVKSAIVAEKSIPGIITRLEQKAQKVSQKKTGNLLNKVSSYLDYTNDKGSFISIHVFSIDRYIIQIYTLNKGAFLNAAQNQLFFNTLSYSGSTTQPSNNTNITNNTNSTTTTNPNNVATTNTGGWQLNDRAEIFDAKENKWFGCVIIKVNTDGTYRIAYDGYGDTYDEDVSADKLKKPTSNTTPANLPYIKVVKGSTVYVKGNLKSGQVMEDLEWAELSSMACWPGIRNVEFEGSHVGYWFDLPKKSIVKITVTPASTSSRINLYGYSGFDLKKTPPEVSRCVSCEASHPTWIGQPNLSEPSKPQTIEFNTTTRNTFVYLGVAGAKNVLQGDYTISIEIQ